MKPLIVANWKMNPPTLAEAKQLFHLVKKGIKNIENVEVVICPPFLYLSSLLKPKTSNFKPKFGAQDCFWENSGAYTGEISPSMLKDLGCEYVIIGHSERRKYFNESEEMINKKIKATISAKLKSILCIGEREEERRAGKVEKVLKNQLEKSLKEVDPWSNLLVAYEPVWAIGTGKACGISEAKAANLFIRKTVKNLPLLYGGSVNSQNAKDYIEKAGFQGLLVGGVSLKAKEFIKLIRNISLS